MVMMVMMLMVLMMMVMTVMMMVTMMMMMMMVMMATYSCVLLVPRSSPEDFDGDSGYWIIIKKPRPLEHLQKKYVTPC